LKYREIFFNILSLKKRLDKKLEYAYTSENKKVKQDAIKRTIIKELKVIVIDTNKKIILKKG
jgi:hypothetical protein